MKSSAEMSSMAKKGGKGETIKNKRQEAMVIMSFVMLLLISFYLCISGLTLPEILSAFWRRNESRGAVLIVTGENLEPQLSVHNAITLEKRHARFTICNRLSHSSNDSRGLQRNSFIRTQQSDSIELFFCIATKFGRNKSDVLKDFMSGAKEVVELRIGSGPQTRAGVFRTLLEAVGVADQLVASGMLPVVSMRVNRQKQDYVNRLASLMELEPCLEDMIKSCAEVCDAAEFC